MSEDGEISKGNPVAVILTVCSMFLIGPWMLPISYIAIICLTLRDEFLSQRKDFEREVASNLKFNLERHRRRHMAVTNLVKHWDSICGTFVLCVFVLNVPSCCFIVYTLIIQSSGDRLHEILFVWLPCLSASLSEMLIVTAAGSMLQLSVSSNQYTL